MLLCFLRRRLYVLCLSTQCRNSTLGFGFRVQQLGCNGAVRAYSYSAVKAIAGTASGLSCTDPRSPVADPSLRLQRPSLTTLKPYDWSEVIGSCAMGEPGWCLASLRQGLTRAAVFSNAQHFNLPLFIMQYFSTRLTLSLVSLGGNLHSEEDATILIITVVIVRVAPALMAVLFPVPFFIPFPCRSRCRTLVQNIPYTVARGCSVFHLERFGLRRR